MTVSTVQNRYSYSGNGVTTAFAYSSKFLANGDLVVVLISSADVPTEKTLTTHYTVTGAGVASGGTVTMLTPPAAGETLVIYGDPALTQAVDLVEGDNLAVETQVETPLDRLTLIAQALSDKLGRTIRIADGNPAVETELATAGKEGYYLRLNADGDEFELAAGDQNDSTFTQSGTGGVERSVTAKLAEVFSVADFGTQAQHTAEAANRFTVDIPTDYATLQLAVDTLSSHVVGNNVEIVLNIKAGHALTAGLRVENGDFGRFRITAEDATVTLAPAFSTVDPSNYRAIMVADNARAPIWDCLVNAGGQTGFALTYVNGSSGYITAGSGVTHSTDAANGAGLFLRNSMVSARNTVFTDNHTNAWISRASIADLEDAVLDDADHNGIYATIASLVSGQGASATGCGAQGFMANGGLIFAQDSDVSGCDIGARAGNGGYVEMTDGVATGCTTNGVRAENGGRVIARNVDTTGAGDVGFNVATGGHVIKDGGTGTVSQRENAVRGKGLISNSDIESADVSMADDTAISIDATLAGVGAKIGMLHIASLTVANGRPNGMIRYRVGTSPALTAHTNWLERTTNITLTTGALTGTTGSDGNFTISAHTDGKIYLENRTGGSVTITWDLTGL